MKKLVTAALVLAMTVDVLQAAVAVPEVQKEAKMPTPSTSVELDRQQVLQRFMVMRQRTVPRLPLMRSMKLAESTALRLSIGLKMIRMMLRSRSMRIIP